MKEVAHICRNCGLFKAKEKVCGVTIIKDGEYHEITTLPDAPCIWEEMGIEIDQIRIWSDGTNGFIESPQHD